MTRLIKYPQTLHLPWSEGRGRDDGVLQDVSCFDDKHIVVTVKMDGEDTTMYRDDIHFRSLDSAPHPSQDYVRALHGRIKHLIPNGWRICGENLYARHPIHYTDLHDWFLVFSVWDEKNECLGWYETIQFCRSLNLAYVDNFTVLNMKVAPENHRVLIPNDFIYGEIEGYVVRNSGTFHYNDFSKNVAKWVRKDHVQSNEHWKKKWRDVPNMINKVESE
jgi:hypothetical protein